MLNTPSVTISDSFSDFFKIVTILWEVQIKYPPITKNNRNRISAMLPGCFLIILLEYFKINISKTIVKVKARNSISCPMSVRGCSPVKLWYFRKWFDFIFYNSFLLNIFQLSLCSEVDFKKFYFEME